MTPVPPIVRLIVLEEVSIQASFGISAHDELYLELKREDQDTHRVFMRVQSMLVSTANVLKLIWPADSAPTRSRRRGEWVRDELGLDDREWQIREARWFRNQFEHFDEKLDAWAYGVAAKNLGIVDLNTGIEVPGGVAVHRNLDPEGFLQFRDRKLDLASVRDELEQLRRRSDTALERRVLAAAVPHQAVADGDVSARVAAAEPPDSQGCVRPAEPEEHHEWRRSEHEPWSAVDSEPAGVAPPVADGPVVLRVH